ncbi:hypothetical protein ARMGADRAFT_1088493 [Armillaria gallica]|uniref:Uncharacterized protein n=1 Tax=Armillaria gallica TaxID=47427 RepID=A0A2H3CMH0_ARMGA|nr:hypothetical protein ARMGADRAFT_1088493 [Armillaria gallica]
MEEASPCWKDVWNVDEGTWLVFIQRGCPPAKLPASSFAPLICDPATSAVFLPFQITLTVSPQVSGPAIGPIFGPRRCIVFRGAGGRFLLKDNVSLPGEQAPRRIWGSRVNRRDEHDRLQMREGGADPHLILSTRTVSRYVPHHSPMPVSTPPPTLASFNDARIVVEGASFMPRPWIVVRGARSRCPHMHSTGDVRVLASSGLPVALREGWMDGIFFSLSIDMQESSTLRRYSPPFNPLRLIK